MTQIKRVKLMFSTWFYLLDMYIMESKKHKTLSMVKPSKSMRKLKEIENAFKVLNEIVAELPATDAEDFELIKFVCNAIENLEPTTLKKMSGEDKKQLAIRLIREKFPDVLGEVLPRISRLIDNCCDEGLVKKVATSKKFWSSVASAVCSFFA